MDIPITVHHDKDENQNNESTEQNTSNGDGNDNHHADEHHGHEHEHNHDDKQGGLSRTSIIAIVVIVVAVAVYFLFLRPTQPLPPVDEQQPSDEIVQDAMSDIATEMKDASPSADIKAITLQQNFLSNIADIEYTSSGTLVDVTNKGASGTVGAQIIDSVYHLFASFKDLPALEEGFFYEGWIVRKDPLDIVSTGALMKHNEKDVNAYLSKTNLLDHVTYVLTLEPDDGDPAPAKHVLEGEITSN